MPMLAAPVVMASPGTIAINNSVLPGILGLIKTEKRPVDKELWESPA